MQSVGETHFLLTLFALLFERTVLLQFRGHVRQLAESFVSRREVCLRHNSQSLIRTKQKIDIFASVGRRLVSASFFP